MLAQDLQSFANQRRNMPPVEAVGIAIVDAEAEHPRTATIGVATTT
jgi:hypothetical protein